MKPFEIKARFIDLSARIESLEALIIGYIKISERRSVSCEVLMGYYFQYLDILRKKIVAQSDDSSQLIEDNLTQQMNDAQCNFDFYQRWLELADSVEDFENQSKFEQAHPPKR